MFVVVAPNTGPPKTHAARTHQPHTQQYSSEQYSFLRLDASGRELDAPQHLSIERFARMSTHPDFRSATWVFDRLRYPAIALRRHGIRLRKAHDLWLTRRILRNAPGVVQEDPYIQGLQSVIEPALTADPEDRPWLIEDSPQQSLFGEENPFDPSPQGPTLKEVTAELRTQLRLINTSQEPQKLALLVRAESAGGLVAADLEYDGLPWDRAAHEQLLIQSLGPRTRDGIRPSLLAARAAKIEKMLGAGAVNPDSPADLLRALRRAGFDVPSTRKWYLKPLAHHPVIAEILAYKKLSRLATTNGWHWLDTWVQSGRLRSEYVVGGVPSGRWVSLGGGLMQLPRPLRATVRAEEGHRLVVADVAQLEPRILAAMSRDTPLAEAARGHDLYQAIADETFQGQRDHAKIAVLGAMYGATTGEAGAFLPALARAYPTAMALVEEAARRGEQGQSVQSYLGRGTPVETRIVPDLQDSITDQTSMAQIRTRGRFARNFMVQAAAAEWALCWLATIRIRLMESLGQEASLVYFLHDEVIVHARENCAGQAAKIVEEAAETATEVLFGTIPVDFPLSLKIVHMYADSQDPSDS